ncbi:MAG: CBS domain-containing protein [Actinobacteria bacterium]|nr:CBS domain-containing protein [Actinomycetota bacterium]
MPVVDAEGNVVGMISERDLAHALGSPLVRLAVRRYSHGSQPREGSISQSQRRARDIMSAPAIVAAPEATVSELARLMVENHLNRLPIIKDGQLVGVVTRGDVLRAVAGLKRATSDRREVVRIAGTPGVSDSRIYLQFESDPSGRRS